jgi:hypothetical protein
MLNLLLCFNNNQSKLTNLKILFRFLYLFYELHRPLIIEGNKSKENIKRYYFLL